MQQAAKQRLQTLQQALANQSMQQSSQMAEGQSPQDQAGQGEPPSGSDEIDLIDEKLADGDWGNLRDQNVEDASQGRKQKIVPGYRNEVQAYFKALSRRAAEKK